jgi:putative oxidoreductase
MMEYMNKVSVYCHNPSVGLLLLRIATGYVFFMHGLNKVSNITASVGLMGHFGLPAWVAFFIAWLEVIGGVALAFGFLTRVFAVAFGIEMVVAFFLTGFARGLAAHDLEIVLALNSFAIAFAGAGKYRLMHVFEHDQQAPAVQ